VARKYRLVTRGLGTLVFDQCYLSLTLIFNVCKAVSRAFCNITKYATALAIWGKSTACTSPPIPFIVVIGLASSHIELLAESVDCYTNGLAVRVVGTL